jgi:hypothetical protein
MIALLGLLAMGRHPRQYARNAKPDWHVFIQRLPIYNIFVAFAQGPVHKF